MTTSLIKNADLFGKMQLFKGVSLDAISDVLCHCDEREYASGELLLSPYMLNKEMYLILRGKVSVHLDNVNSPPFTALGTGECVGEMSLFDGQPRSAYVKVTEPSTMLVIRQPVLWEMVDASHGVARNLLHILSRRIRSSNAAVTQIQKQKRWHERAATLDALTGLNNRRWLELLLDRLTGEALTAQLPLGVVMLDLDDFKRLNDDYGHQAGDAMLRALGKLLRQNVRPGDMVARYGGEEFVVLLPNTTRTGAVVWTERLRQSMADNRVRLDGRLLPAVTFSAGIAECAAAEPIQQTIKEADAALYRAKRAGRNRVCE